MLKVGFIEEKCLYPADTEVQASKSPQVGFKNFTSAKSLINCSLCDQIGEQDMDVFV